MDRIHYTQIARHSRELQCGPEAQHSMFNSMCGEAYLSPLHLYFEKPGRLRGPSSHVAPYHALVSRRQTSVPGQFDQEAKLPYATRVEKKRNTVPSRRAYIKVFVRATIKMVGDQSADGVFVPQKNFFLPLESTTIPYGVAQGARESENSGWRGVYGIKKKLLIMCAREIRSPHLVTD